MCLFGLWERKGRKMSSPLHVKKIGGERTKIFSPLPSPHFDSLQIRGSRGKPTIKTINYVKLKIIKNSMRGHRPTGKKGEGKTPHTHQVMSLNPWEAVTPKMGNSGGDFGLVGSPKGGRTTKALRKKSLKTHCISFCFFSNAVSAS